MRDLDWGIPTLLEATDLEHAAALCRTLGFQFVELNMNLPEYQKWDIPLLQGVASCHQIYFTIHLDENLDMCNFNVRIADAYLQTLLETIKIAGVLGVPILNMHLLPGVYFTLPEKKMYLYNMYKDRFLDRLREVIELCEAAAQGCNLSICIENTGNFALPFLQEALELLLQSPLFQLTFDIGHNHSAQNADRPFLLQHENRLRHFHIHDALGGKNHLALGSGELDLLWHIDLAKKTHSRAVLEVKTVQALLESVDWLHQHDSR
ncbi:sugar phosphate isomerase/epimerase [Acutalibacter sp. 1XD8-33]|uniref:TIM barrel protein n=1 Tax=Acutalibacter sp. 1XD8-33 TaxID=2320081 RepID=UPI000EA299AB|nr:TIM barrel protein [Acutalibacter sp. 1XD8-33]RKJ40446.1 sugar phosphate isomerase/epimerase [Acutalibacter sp. 1XD8-33]